MDKHNDSCYLVIIICTRCYTKLSQNPGHVIKCYSTTVIPVMPDGFLYLIWEVQVFFFFSCMGIRSWAYIIYYMLSRFVITPTRFCRQQWEYNVMAADTNGTNTFLWCYPPRYSTVQTCQGHNAHLSNGKCRAVSFQATTHYGSVKILQKFVKIQLFVWDNSLLTFMVSCCSWIQFILGIITNFGVAIIKYNKKFAIISYNPGSIFLMDIATCCE